MSDNFLGTLARLDTAGGSLRFWSLPRLAERTGADVERLPFTVRILLENLLRRSGQPAVSEQDVISLAGWPEPSPAASLAFLPSRVLMQDFTGVPAVVDLAALRSAVGRAGGDPRTVNPAIPVDLVVDHSVQVDRFGSADAYKINLEWEYRRNSERYSLLKWAQQAFHGFRVVPPGMGICHQVNLESLSRVVATQDGAAFPETLAGTDSHTTMINGLGILGWGVGGIEAEAAMLGQPMFLAPPQVVGVRLSESLPAGSSATDLVLTLTQMLRSHGVVGKFVEFFGEGISALPVWDRATISNMSPEFGATAALFPIDANTIRYLKETGRAETTDLVERYARENLMYRDSGDRLVFDSTLELDLSSVEPSLAGPSRPQDRVPLGRVKESFAAALQGWMPHPPPVEVGRLVAEGGNPAAGSLPQAALAPDEAPLPEAHAFAPEGEDRSQGDMGLGHGSVVISAITSCTNTSNPSVMIAAGLLAKKAVEAGLSTAPWVKTSLAPGSRVVTSYLDRAGLLPYLEKLGFNVVGYGCTTCIGNSGPLPGPVDEQLQAKDLAVVAVLSGNRNFEGRIHPQVRASYLASPPLCVAYALAGRVDIDLTSDPVGSDAGGDPVYLHQIWPGPEEVDRTMAESMSPEQFDTEYGRIFEGDDRWRRLPAPSGDLYDWDPQSTYVREPPYFQESNHSPGSAADILNARALVLLGDSITTDHISPAGAIRVGSPAAVYLSGKGVRPEEFNSFGARRGNHEVMLRGTFGNIRLKNKLAPGTEGPWTTHLPEGEKMAIYDASIRYGGEGISLIAVGGKDYGSGSSRDWAAKGTALLGIKAVLAESFERIHRSNLVGMGVLPLEFEKGTSAESLGLTGSETFDIRGLTGLRPGTVVAITAVRDGQTREFPARVRIDTPAELDYYLSGGILNMVLKKILPQN